eukprot:1393724-Amorphochlora_amoeboformis.AAC.2
MTSVCWMTWDDGTYVGQFMISKAVSRAISCPSRLQREGGPRHIYGLLSPHCGITICPRRGFGLAFVEFDREFPYRPSTSTLKGLDHIIDLNHTHTLSVDLLPQRVRSTAPSCESGL